MNNQHINVLYKMIIPNDIVVNIAGYLDYLSRINIAKLNKEIYKQVYPKLRYIIYWEDSVSPSEYSENLYLCKSIKDAREKYKIANKNIKNYGDDGLISVDIVIDGEIKRWYSDEKLRNLYNIINCN